MVYEVSNNDIPDPPNTTERKVCSRISNKMALSQILKAIFVMPFTAGNSRTAQRRPLDLDGTTSTAVLRMFFFCLILLLVKTTTDAEHPLINFVGMQICLSVIVFLGLLSCLIALIIIKVKGFHSIMVRRSDVKSSRLQMTVLWAFGMLSLTFIFLKSGHIIQCIYNQGRDITGDVPVMECVYYGLIFVLLPIQMLTLTYLTPYRFRNFLGIQYMIQLVLASNLTMWVYGLLQHDMNYSQVDFGNETWHTNCTNMTFTHMLNVSDQILSPIFLEYSMLAITMTQNLSVKWKTWSNDRENHDENERAEMVTELLNPDEVGEQDVSQNEDTALLPTTNVSRMRRQSVGFYASLMFSALVGVSIFIGYVVRVTGHVQITMNWLPLLELVFSITMTVCTFAVYYFLARDTHPPTMSKSISGGDYVFIISSLGSLTGRLLRLLVSLKLANTNRLLMSSRVVFCGLCYLQTVLILHASRCSPKHNPRSMSLGGALLLMALYNCGFWIVESFIMGNYPVLEETEKRMLGQGMFDFRNNVCHPLEVFFRFASALEFYELYRKFGRRKD
ncbi:uncharacterized protein [Argopecten irradians]|uniref:uncharacterized protein n=1 Tax=Argopecten irradians TaxID=31199 RepID=UPI003718A397